MLCAPNLRAGVSAAAPRDTVADPSIATDLSASLVIVTLPRITPRHR
jgi:hypothetical protein